MSTDSAFGATQGAMADKSAHSPLSSQRCVRARRWADPASRPHASASGAVWRAQLSDPAGHTGPALDIRAGPPCQPRIDLALYGVVTCSPHRPASRLSSPEADVSFASRSQPAAARIRKGDGPLTAVATPAAAFTSSGLRERYRYSSRLGRPTASPAAESLAGHAFAQVRASMGGRSWDRTSDPSLVRRHGLNAVANKENPGR
jgi:hypothetical protein